MKAIKIFGKFARCQGKLAIFKSNQRTSPQVPAGKTSFLSTVTLFAFFPELPFSLPPPCFLCLVDSDTVVENLFILDIHLNRSFE